MGFINCCGKAIISDVYSLVPDKNSIWAVLRVMKDVCPQCDNFKIQIDRIDCTGEFKSIVYENAKAYEKYFKLKHSGAIDHKIEHKENICGGSAFYLYYSEYGKKKKCYSNLSTLKMGMFENSDLLRTDLIAV